LINMSELPRAAAQAAAATDFTRGSELQAVDAQSLPTNELSSAVTVDANG
jgi:hypothetical protein